MRWSWAMSTSAFMFSSLSTAPVGLAGEFIMSAFVFGVIFSFTASEGIVKPSLSLNVTPTGFASANFVSGANETNPGFGISTSSPLSTTARSAICNASLAPAVTIISSGLTEKSLSRLNLSHIAALSSAMPLLEV